MATYVEVEAIKAKKASLRKLAQIDSSETNDKNNTTNVQIRGNVPSEDGGNKTIFAKIENATGVNKIKIGPEGLIWNKENELLIKSKEQLANGDLGEENVNVVSIKHIETDGKRPTQVRADISPAVPKNRENLSTIEIRDKNRTEIDELEKEERDILYTRQEGEYYGACSVGGQERGVSIVDVIDKNSEKARKCKENERRRKVPLIDIEEFIRGQKPRNSQVHFPSPPSNSSSNSKLFPLNDPYPNDPTQFYQSDIPKDGPLRKQYTTENIYDMPNEEIYGMPNEDIYQHSDNYSTLKSTEREKPKKTFRKNDRIYNVENGVYGSNFDSLYEEIRDTKGIQTGELDSRGTENVKKSRIKREVIPCANMSTQTNREAGTQTVAFLESKISVMEPRILEPRNVEPRMVQTRNLEPRIVQTESTNQGRFSSEEDEDVAHLYSQIREVKKKKDRGTSYIEQEDEEDEEYERGRKRRERRLPERSDSKRSNRSVPPVLKPRSELRKQIEPVEPFGVESLDNSDSETESSALSSRRSEEVRPRIQLRPVAKSSDTSNREDFSFETESTTSSVRREEMKMRRLTRLDQVKKPVIKKTEVRNADPVAALANLRDRPQLLGVFSIKTYSNNPQSKCRPTGLAITPGGSYVITDNFDKAVKIFNKSGQVKVEFKEGDLVKPWGATLMDNGNIAVSDPGDTSVKIFTRKGKFVKKFEFANLVEPYGITKTNAGDVLVADKGANKLYVFDGNGFLKGSLGSSNEEPIADWPQFITVDSKDNIIVSDYLNHKVRIFSPTGKLVKEHGGMGVGTAQLMCPKGICVDKFGHILVADNINARVKILSPEGDFIRDLVDKKSGMEGPEAVAIDQDGNLVVTDGINGEVKLFSYVM